MHYRGNLFLALIMLHWLVGIDFLRLHEDPLGRAKDHRTSEDASKRQVGDHRVIISRLCV